MVALAGARLRAYPGEVHAVLGENGAGKSTLAHILGGLVQPDRGDVLLRGTPVRLRSPREAARHGIGLVHQHFKLVPTFTALENVALTAARGLVLPLEAMRRRAEEVAHAAQLDVDLDARIEDLGVGARQRVEVLKLLYDEPAILVLDEPTAVLPPTEVDGLLATLRALADEGRTVVLIAHKLDEVLAVADRITVLRHGATVLEAARGEVTAERLTRAMVGDTDAGVPTRTQAAPGEPVVRAEGLTHDDSRGPVRDISFTVLRGEIVGVAGVEGNGQRTLALLLAGRLRPDRGTLEQSGKAAFVPQDRIHEGTAQSLDLSENTALGSWRDAPFRQGALMDWRAVRQRAAAVVERYDVRTDGLDRAVATLSGGNQQKLVVGREIMRGPDLLVVENPTRGLDVGAAAAVQRAFLELRDRGGDAPGIVIFSTDLDEVLALADRIFVMVRGRLVPVPGDPPTRHAIGAAMLATDSAGSAERRS